MAIGSILDLTDVIREITDKDYSGFQGFPANNSEVGSRWSDVIDLLGGSVNPPSLSTIAAKQAFATIMLGANAGGIPVLISACSAYATALALGMQPTFTGVPPIMPPVIIPTGLITNDAHIEATQLATALRLWFSTGTAVNNTTGVTIPWT